MDDISVYILKPFPFSRNGVKEEQAELNATIDIPDRLFDALNREGYVRRAQIGNGHISLRAEVADQTKVLEAAFTEIITVATGPGVTIPDAVLEEAVAATATVDVNNGPARVVTPAPQPPAATADLTKEELAALADGSWKDWRFFKQRSVAAKISDLPIKDGADAKAAIEAYIAPKEH